MGELNRESIQDNRVHNGIKWSSKLLIGYLYFIQGVYFGVSSSLILTYKQIPSYSILSMFTAATLPFSFKFISAPFTERYTSFNYGRRKTWVVGSLIAAGLIMLVQSKFSSEEDQIIAAALFFAIILFISLEDISVDGLALKELGSPQMASLLQSVMQLLGYFVGSMVFLQLVSSEAFLSKLLGATAPIIQVKTFICLVAMATIIPALVIHFTYTQTMLKSQIQQHKKGIESLWSVIKQYKCFFMPKYRVCRQAILFVLYPHGIGYFNAGFPIQLIKNYGFSKQLMTTLSNASIGPVVVITYILSRLIEDKQISIHSQDDSQIKTKRRLFKLYSYQEKFLIVRLLLCFILFLGTASVASSTVLCSFALMTLTILSNSQFLIDSTLVNSHSSTAKYSAMYVTMMASLSNLGRNTSIQLEVIGIVGYNWAVAFGILYFFVWVIIFRRVAAWVTLGLSQQISIQNQLEQQSIKNN